MPLSRSAHVRAAVIFVVVLAAIWLSSLGVSIYFTESEIPGASSSKKSSGDDNDDVGRRGVLLGTSRGRNGQNTQDDEGQ